MGQEVLGVMDGRLVVENRSHYGEIKAEEITIATVFWVWEEFEDVEESESIAFSVFEVKDPRMEYVEEETEERDGNRR